MEQFLAFELQLLLGDRQIEAEISRASATGVGDFESISESLTNAL